jgi:hypothetical protein
MTPDDPGPFNPELVAALEAERLTGMPRWNVKDAADLRRHAMRKANRDALELRRRDHLRIVPDDEAGVA